MILIMMKIIILLIINLIWKKNVSINNKCIINMRNNFSYY